jgi:enoyl-CoA hydratase
MEPVVRFEQRGAVAVATIDRPKALNALNGEVIDQLSAIVDAVRANPEVRALILCGAGEKAFVAGADIAAMSELNALEAEAFAAKGHALGDALEALPIPVICAVQGFALGGGCELAMCADILLAGPKARFGQPEVNLGVIPGFGGTQRLVRRVGTAKALDLCLTGRVIDAIEAERIGLVSRVVEGDVFEAALEVAEEIAKKGPVAVRLVKRVIQENADANVRTGLAAERTAFGLCFATSDQKEGMSAFLNKRPAQFTGR